MRIGPIHHHPPPPGPAPNPLSLVTPAEAKQILLLRRGPFDDSDPQVAAAQAVAAADPELHAWLSAQEQFHTKARAAFRSLPVPPDLSDQIRAARTARAQLFQHPQDDQSETPPAEGPAPVAIPLPIRLPWWKRYPAWAAAAALIAAFALVFLNRQPADPGDTDSFATFRSRMVRSVLRQYQMDIETNDMAVIRQFLSTNQAPSDYVLSANLSRLTPRGAGLQRWLDQPVSMVCFDAASQHPSVQGTAVLFVLDSRAVDYPPPANPDFQQVSKLMTASWSNAGRTYLLMVDNSQVDEARLRQLF